MDKSNYILCELQTLFHLCKVKDILIIGGGLAGSTLAFRAYQNKLTFDWISSSQIPSASSASYGLLNPVNIRNASVVWNANQLIESAKKLYSEISDFVGQSIYKSTSILHTIHSDEEFNFWRQQIETTNLFQFSDGEMYTSSSQLKSTRFVKIDHGLVLDTTSMMILIQKKLNEYFQTKDFNFSDIFISTDFIEYQSNKYKKVIFCEGKHGATNPYFSYLPFNPCKGEILEVALNEPIEYAIHSNKMLVPNLLGNYFFGSTYSWNDEDFSNTESGIHELEKSLSELVQSDSYSIIQTKAGVRPTVSDRRPLLGWHTEFPNVGILNGLGTKGTMYVAEMSQEIIASLFDSNFKFNSHWDIHRFEKRRKRLEFS